MSVLIIGGRCYRRTLKLRRRLAPKTEGRWEVGPQNRWAMGSWPAKQVGDGRLAHKTGGIWEVDTIATPPH